MKKKVLIIEEDFDLRAFWSIYLSAEFQVLPASDVLEAYCWIRKGLVPDVIFSTHNERCGSTEHLEFLIGGSGVLSGIPIIATDTPHAKSIESQRFDVLVAESLSLPVQPMLLKQCINKYAGSQRAAVPISEAPVLSTAGLASEAVLV